MWFEQCSFQRLHYVPHFNILRYFLQWEEAHTNRTCQELVEYKKNLETQEEQGEIRDKLQKDGISKCFFVTSLSMKCVSWVV